MCKNKTHTEKYVSLQKEKGIALTRIQLKLGRSNTKFLGNALKFTLKEYK
jgi:hypothetical protein